MMVESVQAFLRKEMSVKHAPGACLQVSCNGEIVLSEVFGNKTVFPRTSPMKKNTVFDLASLTKVVATMPALMRLLDAGELTLDDPVSHFLPAFAQQNKASVTVKHLLTHTSGLPAHRPYHTYDDLLSTEMIIAEICAEPLQCQPGSRVIYSDLGFMLLYKIVELITEEPFEHFVKREIFERLNMRETAFNPSFAIDRYASTAYCEKLNDYKRGVVHDENAELMLGISGHAGLFSTLHDVQNYTSMIENHGVFNGERILSKAAVDLSKLNFTPFDSQHRGLGWMLKSQSSASCGDLFSDQSYGHTGFTGTSIWFDPTLNVHVIFLTNRVHTGDSSSFFRLRARLHNFIRSHF
ncbi:serine hydrolase domain-containing protein [Salisediminibacterium beveridgei]|uniref:Putative Beta-lactamase, class C n=1 Tax=Salisediminibacterium beveridgei TaxID=632773 RepID=A0A1D7QZW0_9BACI|nr:serine hydrolase domain-containing protein [Salisediminibacterium beveridgei]AOM84500.1 putative Beta-lactamase, class C [Salisediminibacterium beveridgei]